MKEFYPSAVGMLSPISNKEVTFCEAVTDLISEYYQCGNSDAQGMMETQSDLFADAFAEEMTPEAAFKFFLANRQEETDREGGPGARTPGQILMDALISEDYKKAKKLWHRASPERRTAILAEYPVFEYPNLWSSLLLHIFHNPAV